MIYIWQVPLIFFSHFPFVSTSLIAPSSKRAPRPHCAVGSGCLIGIFPTLKQKETRRLSPQQWVLPVTSQPLMSIANEQEMSSPGDEVLPKPSVNCFL